MEKMKQINDLEHLLKDRELKIEELQQTKVGQLLDKVQICFERFAVQLTSLWYLKYLNAEID